MGRECIAKKRNQLDFTKSSFFLTKLVCKNKISGHVQSSRKRRIRRIFTPIFAFERVKFPSEDSHLRSIATGRPN